MNFKKPEVYVEERPWGKFEQFTSNETTTVKIITVKSGEQLSLQTHSKRAEFWRIIDGEGEATIGDEQIPAKEGDELFVAIGERHTIKAGPEGIRFLEIAFGEFDEADINRIEDKYGRTT